MILGDGGVRHFKDGVDLRRPFGHTARDVSVLEERTRALKLACTGELDDERDARQRMA